MPTLWFLLTGAMLIAYVVFDGYDLGAGIVHFGVARSTGERRQVIASIGPVWDGNEVWLLAAGGTLYFAFPALYAAAFSGFYLPLLILLWLLILRGISIEFRGMVDAPLWRPLWDTVFCGSSGLIALILGAAAGNLVRGVPLDAEGFFFLPLWGSFTTSGELGILDFYTVLTGLLGVAALAMHGALWVALKTEGAVAERSRKAASIVWWAVLLLTLGAAPATVAVQPQVAANLASAPWGYAIPVIALAALGAVRFFDARRDLAKFLASVTYLAAALGGIAFGIYPYVLPSSPAGFGLTVTNAAAREYGLRVGLLWWLVGMALVTGYFVFTHRQFSARIAAEPHADVSD